MSVPLDPLHFCETNNNSNNICNTQWLTLYTTAAYLPETFQPADKQLASDFFNNFTDQCRESPIAGALNGLSPNLNSRRELMLSLCSTENELRQKAGLPLRPCRYNKLMQRWRYADGYL